MNKQRIAIFASGTGSNAMNLIRQFRDHDSIEVALVISNIKDAPIVESTKAAGVEVKTITNDEARNGSLLVALCRSYRADWLVLAGYLRLIPTELIRAYPHRIINLHPSLLPKYGGKGMYGQNVHKAVIENQEPVSGITIHFIDEEFDRGEIIAQFYCAIQKEDSHVELDQKIRTLEQSYFPTVIEKTILINSL